MALPRVWTIAIAGGLAAAVSLTGVGSAAADQQPAASGGDVHDSGQDLAGGYWDPQPVTRASTTDDWPDSSTVVAQLEKHGINPILSPGYDDLKYQSHAHLTSNTPFEAVVMHDTGTGIPASRLGQTASLNWILSGVKNSDGQTIRASHFYVDRTGVVYFIYAHRTWHAGAGDSMFGIPANMMNGYSYGIEIESQGGGVQDLTQSQITSATKVAAALLEVGGLGVNRAINHKDYAGRVQGKVDTAYPITWWRGLIAKEMGVTYTAPAAPVINPDPKTISMAMMHFGKDSPYVMRYQKALRKYAKTRGFKINKINPSGATGYYGTETRTLTKSLRKLLEKHKVAWRVYAGEVVRGLPGTKLIRKIGMKPIA